MAIKPELFNIDPDNLDEEWLEQPKFVLKYLLKAADARERLDRAKAKLDVTRAELDKMIREDPTTFDILAERVTEAMVAAAISLQPEFKEANDEIISAKHDLDIANAVVTALDHRKRALENLVDLHGMGYFSEPQATSAGRNVVDEITKRKVRSGHNYKFSREDDE